MTMELGLAIMVKMLNIMNMLANYDQQITIKTIFMLIIIIQPFPSC